MDRPGDSARRAAMQVFVRDLHGRSVVLDVDAEGSVGTIRAALRLRTGLPIEELVLTTCSGAVLVDDARSLAEHGIGAEASLQLGGRLLGGGGKKKAKIMPKVQPLEKHKLPSAFLCIFCDHKSIAVKIDKKKKIGTLLCSTCNAKFQCVTHSLAHPVDVYGKWIDECEKQNEEAGDDSGSSEEDEEYELPHKKAGGSAEGSAAKASVKAEADDSDLDDSDLDD